MPNAGLAAYPSWVPTMQALLPCATAQQNLRTETGGKSLLGMPCIVTDYCEEALHKAKVRRRSSRHYRGTASSLLICFSLAGCAALRSTLCANFCRALQAMLQALCGLQPAAHPILVNPFRQPWHQGVQGNVLPSFSNGFMLILNVPHIY